MSARIDLENLAELLKPAQKTRGWNGRRDLPATITLEGGCEVHVVPAWLWQPRIKPYVERFDMRPTPLRRVGGTR